MRGKSPLQTLSLHSGSYAVLCTLYALRYAPYRYTANFGGNMHTAKNTDYEVWLLTVKGAENGG
jgi:hypothetical protein